MCRSINQHNFVTLAHTHIYQTPFVVTLATIEELLSVLYGVGIIISGCRDILTLSHHVTQLG